MLKKYTTDELITDLIKKCGFGAVICPIEPVSGGLMHKMYHIRTDHGIFKERLEHGRNTSNDGWLHWVAVKREYQGKGLSKPLITFVLRVMNKLGHVHAKVPTQTNTCLACKVYMDLGFTPVE